jgi:hypothetical protein
VAEPASAAELADAVVRNRDALITLARRCSREQWVSSPLSDDPRPVGVIIDHVADWYATLAPWVAALLAGEAVEVSQEIIDARNAVHASTATTVACDAVVSHLRQAGNAMADAIRPLSAAQLDADKGWVRRFAEVAARHSDDHRTDIEGALFAQSRVP